MIVFVGICAALAGFAWLRAEAKIERMRRRIEYAETTAIELAEEIRERRAGDILRRRASAKHWSGQVLDRVIFDVQNMPTDELAARRHKGA